MNKKFLSLVLALVMVLGTFSSVFAAKPAEKKETKEAPKAAETVVPKLTGKTEKIKWLQDKGIVEGRKVNEDPKNNDLALDKTIQRAEVSKLLVFATGKDTKVDALKGITIYKDVALNHWANGYINVGSTEPSDANKLPFLLGYPGNVFKPANNVTYAELAKMLVTLTKTDLTKDMHDKANKAWPAQWMAWAADMGIFEDVTVADANKAVNREDAFTMIYNAMYKLQNIKKFPVNETMGIVSQIKNGEITLNQGDKAKTVKLTPNTTFVLYNRSYDVNASASLRDRVVLARVLSNPSYYYGSFVRVISNEKGEATHVLELGNPADGALGNCDNKDNARWSGVAERTVEALGRDYAKVEFKDGDAKSIYFVGSAIKLNLTKATKYFVADVVKNQLTEVKDVDEAMRIVGNTRYNTIEQVYAGYDVIGESNAYATHKATNIKGHNEAKVVVFNVAQKDNNGTQMLRVKMDANTNYNIALEDVDGKVVLNNVEAYRLGFPNNYAKKLDVINYGVNAAKGVKIEKVIEHGDTKMFPIVKVTKVNGSYIEVQDAYNRTAQLKADQEVNVFTNGLANVKVGDMIQFRTLAGNVIEGKTATQANTVDVISIMPAGVKAAGTLQTVVYDNQAEQRVGEVTRVEQVGSVWYATIVKPQEGLYGDYTPTEKVVAVVDNQDAKDLKAWIADADTNKVVLFKVQPYDDKEQRAFDFMALYNNKWMDLGKALVQKSADDAAAKQAQKDALEAFNNKVAAVTDATTLADQAAFDKAAKDLKALVDEFKALKVDKLEKSDVDKVKANLNTKIKALNDAAAAKTPAIKTNPTVAEI